MIVDCWNYDVYLDYLKLAIQSFDYFWAVSALIILIFRDIILGFVASVKVSINDMIRIGDWMDG
jgi:small-conductance mechanosensitive channel